MVCKYIVNAVLGGKGAVVPANLFISAHVCEAKCARNLDFQWQLICICDF